MRSEEGLWAEIPEAPAGHSNLVISLYKYRAPAMCQATTSKGGME